MALFTVTVRDNFHGMEEDGYYDLSGFSTWEDAVEYARRLTWNSVEECRAVEPGQTLEVLRHRFAMFGEVASVRDGGRRYSGDDEVEFFLAHPATADQRDYEVLRPAAE